MTPDALRSRAAALDESNEDIPEPSSASKASGARVEKLRAMAKKKKQVCFFHTNNILGSGFSHLSICVNMGL